MALLDLAAKPGVQLSIEWTPSNPTRPPPQIMLKVVRQFALSPVVEVYATDRDAANIGPASFQQPHMQQKVTPTTWI